jgi:tungstate transport system permease protein
VKAIVVPAHAGTHTPRPLFRSTRPVAFVTTSAGGYGSLLSQGRHRGQSIIPYDSREISGYHRTMQDFIEIVRLSLAVSLAATAAATTIGLPLGAALAIFPFRGRHGVVVLVNAFFGLPPVVVGLILYLALSRSGPLGFLHWLFTPTAMVVAQTVLAVPIVTALVHRASERAWARYGDELISDGASRVQAIPQILHIICAEIVTAVLAGFGRTVSEVGAVILVGGNIRGLTRTMTTTIALQTSQGELSLALALGAVLIGISISISATVFALAGHARTAGSDEV